MRTFDCTDIKASLSALLDDQIEKQERYEAERHLAACAVCRALVDQAESSEKLLSRIYDASIQPLSEKFESSVLSQTVYASASSFRRPTWISWLGWVAAAAALTLAVTIWVMDQQLIRTLSTTKVVGVLPQTPQTGTGNELSPQSATVAYGSTASRVSSAGIVNAAPKIDPFPVVINQPLHRGSEKSHQSSKSPISNKAAETFSAAAIVMNILENSKGDDSVGTDYIRLLVENDDLLPRLASARAELDESNQHLVKVTEAILTRISLESLDADEFQNLRISAQRLELSAFLETSSALYHPSETF